MKNMKNMKLSALLLTLILLLALTLCGCGGAAEDQQEGGQESGQESTAQSITFTDMTGRQITLEGPVTRVVALSAADCELLYAIGAGEALVGRGEYCDYPAEVLELPAVQSGMDTNIEQIIQLQPQVLLMSAMAQTEEQIEMLENAGVQVVVSNAQDIEGVYTALAMIGRLMGREQEAAAVVEQMKSTFDQLRAETAGAEEKTVYFEVSPLEYGLWAAGSGTFMDEVAHIVGLRNCFEDVSGWAEISEEQVLERDPDYIVTITMYFGEGPTPEQEIMSRPGWQNVTAVKNGAILNLQKNELSRPTDRLMDGARLLYDFVQEHGPETDQADQAA